MQDGVTARTRAIVVAADEGLRLSLACLLEICGFEVLALAGADELLANCRLDEQVILTDCTMSGCDSFPAIEELRRRGWPGIVIFMAEGELAFDPNLAGERSHVLVKPFSSDEVLAIVGS